MKISGGPMIRRLFWAAAIALGFLQAWASRMDMVVDTISYLDMGDYISAGHWLMAINGVWSPLYACLLALTLHTLHPSAYWQYPAVHLLLFVIFLFAAACFDYFLRQLLLLREEQDTGTLAPPTWVYSTIGYLLFLWSSLGLIRVSETNPDMLIAAFFFLACGLLISIRRGRAGRWLYLTLGLTLGLAYLTKAAMFPISFICLAVASAIDLRSQKRTWGFILAAVLFVGTAAPFITALSLARRKFTFSESGIYNYMTNVNHVQSSHWQGAPEEGQRLLHPTVQIFSRPEAFMFDASPGGSYPVWYDPSYWYEGAKLRFTLRDTVDALYVNLAYLWARLVSAFNGALIASLFLLFYVSGFTRLAWREIAKYWFLLLPSIAALAMYVAVHMEARYVASFLVVAILSLFFGVPTSTTPEIRRVFSGTAMLLTLMFLSPIGPGTIPKNSSSLLELLKPLDAKPNPSAAVASGLLAMGLGPGERIASLEYSLCAIRLVACEGASTWARLGGFRIVAEVYYWPENPATRLNNFWDLDVDTQEKVIAALSRSRARVVVSRQIPRGAEASFWEQIGRTPYYFRWLAGRSNAVSTGTPGPLAVCTTNPRYFCDPNGNVVFLAGDHTWADLQDQGENQAPNTGAFDFNGYMSFLSSHGYTWLRLWAGMFSAYSSTQFDGPVWPWKRVGPGTADDGLLKTDFTQLDTTPTTGYFARLRSRIIQAEGNGLYVSVMLFGDVDGSDSHSANGDPFVSRNNVNGVSCSAPCPTTLPLNATAWNYEQAYIHKVVDTVHDLPNVMYEVANEPDLTSASWVAQVMNEIRTYESATYGSQHPVGMNYGNHVPDSNVYNTDADFVSPSTKLPPAATGQCPVPSGNSARMNRASSRCKVIINDSDHSYYYTVMQSDGTGGQTAWVWENFTLGNGVAFMDPYTFLWPGRNNCARTPNYGDGGLCATNGLDGQWSQIRSAIADVTAYGKKIDLRSMTPQGSLSTSGFCLAALGSQYFVFSMSNSFTLTTVAGTYTFEWFNPSTHATVQTGSVTAKSKEAFTAPFSGNSVLWLHK